MFGAKFLSEALPSAVPPAPVALELEFAATRVSLAGLDEAQVAIVRARFGALVRSVSKAHIAATVVALPERAFREIDTRGWVYEMDLEFSERRIDFAGLGFGGHFSVPLREAVLFTSAGGTPRFIGVIENFFRLLVAYAVLDRGGAMIHSAGIVHHDHADLFFGPSGAGKTTISRLAEKAGLTVLSDELNAVFLDARGDAVVEELPFAGDFGRPPRGDTVRPLGRIHRLYQAPSAKLRPLGPAHALATLLAAAPFVNGDRFRAPRLAENLEGLVAKRPPVGLEFAISTDVFRALDLAEAGLAWGGRA